MPDYYVDDNGNRVLLRHRGPAGPGVPEGGTTGQLLVKTSSTDYAMTWQNSPAGTGAAVGPSEAVDGNIVLFDGITGKLLKDSTKSLSAYATTSLVATKVDKVTGKALSQEDFTTVLKAKLDGLSPGGFRGAFETFTDVEENVFSPVPQAGDYCTIEATGVPVTLALWDSVDEAWVHQTLDAIAMTGEEIAAVLFNEDEVYATEDCMIFTSALKAQLALHESLISSALGGVGATSTSYVEKTASYNVTLNDRTINCTANSFTLTLPTAVGNSGRIYVIKNSGVGTITVACTGGQLIDGVATIDLTTQWESVSVQSTGSAWIIV